MTRTETGRGGIGARKRRLPMVRVDDASGAEGADRDGSRDELDDADDADELEIEVTDLQTGVTVERTLSRIPDGRSPRLTALADVFDGDGAQDHNDATTDAGSLSARERMVRRRQREARAGLVVMIVALALVGLLVSNPGVSGAIHGGMFPPTPTIAPDSNVIWFRHAVPWGRVQIDGHTVQVTNQYAPAFLTPGRHTLTYQAPPFATLRCTVSAPAAPSDTCPRDVNPQNEQDPPPDGERALDLGATPDKLPAASHAALLAAVQRLLDTLTSTAQVMPGDHYGTPDGKVRVATQPMTMTLAFVVPPPNLSGPPLNINGESCDPLCAITDGALSDSPGWQLSVQTAPQWRYTGDGGATQVVTTPAPISELMQGQPTGNLLTFSVGWANGDWQVALPSGVPQNEVPDLECAIVTQTLPPLNSTNGGNGFGVSYVPSGVATQMADGCAVTVTPLNSDSTPVARPALLLLRFGALIAANGEAHQLYPTLPVANAREAALAQQLGSGGWS